MRPLFGPLFPPDRATAYAMATRAFNVATGAATPIVIARSLSPELQGYYFTFAGVLSFQTFLELGFGTLLQQFASHEWAHRDEARARSRLAALVRFSFAWYGAAGLVLIAVLGLGGHLYFAAFGGGRSGWQSPWWGVCALTGLGLLLTPLMSVLEGCGKISSVYGVQLAQSVVGRLSTWGVLLLGGGLWALGAGKAATVIAGAWLLLSARHRDFFRKVWESPGGPGIGWRKEIWPLQWKFALSWLGGYLLHSLFTPVLFAARGPVVAGQMGMTLSVAAAISAIAFARVATHVPRLAMAAARREYGEMDAVFRRAATASFVTAGTGSVGFLTILAGLAWLKSPLADRFLAPFETGLLLLAIVAQQIRYAMGSYLRAHKAEPFFILSLIEGVWAATGLVLAGRAFGARGMCAGFLTITLALLPPAAVIFRRHRGRREA